VSVSVAGADRGELQRGLLRRVRQCDTPSAIGAQTLRVSLGRPSARRRVHIPSQAADAVLQPPLAAPRAAYTHGPLHPYQTILQESTVQDQRQVRPPTASLLSNYFLQNCVEARNGLRKGVKVRAPDFMNTSSIFINPWYCQGPPKSQNVTQN